MRDNRYLELCLSKIELQASGRTDGIYWKNWWFSFYSSAHTGDFSCLAMKKLVAEKRTGGLLFGSYW
jgi:hypothetical protein